MNTLEAIAKRRSTRNYKPEQIPEDALQAILKAGGLLNYTKEGGR